MPVCEAGQLPAEACFEIAHHPGQADPGIALQNLLGRNIDAVLGQAFDIGPHRQHLAVHQHAVAIEDDEIEWHPRRYSVASTATTTIVTLSAAPRASTRSSSRSAAAWGVPAPISRPIS